MFIVSSVSLSSPIFCIHFDFVQAQIAFNLIEFQNRNQSLSLSFSFSVSCPYHFTSMLSWLHVFRPMRPETKEIALNWHVRTWKSMRMREKWNYFMQWNKSNSQTKHLSVQHCIFATIRLMKCMHSIHFTFSTLSSSCRWSFSLQLTFRWTTNDGSDSDKTMFLPLFQLQICSFCSVCQGNAVDDCDYDAEIQSAISSLFLNFSFPSKCSFITIA